MISAIARSFGNCSARQSRKRGGKIKRRAGFRVVYATVNFINMGRLTNDNWRGHWSLCSLSLTYRVRRLFSALCLSTCSLCMAYLLAMFVIYVRLCSSLGAPSMNQSVNSEAYSSHSHITQHNTHIGIYYVTLNNALE